MTNYWRDLILVTLTIILNTIIGGILIALLRPFLSDREAYLLALPILMSSIALNTWIARWVIGLFGKKVEKRHS